MRPLLYAILYTLFPCIDKVFGGFILTLTYIGLAVALHFVKPDFPSLKIGTWWGNWIMIYSIVGNLPLSSFMNLSTLALQGVSFAVGLTMAISLRGSIQPL